MGVRAVRLRGNLGNHLFQFALLRAMGERPVIVDDTLRGIGQLQTLLRPECVRVTTNLEALRLRRPPRIRGRRNLELAARKTRLGPWIERRVANEHRYGSFDPELVETHSVDRRGGTLFNGYFQNEGYFLHAAGDIADSFAPPPAAAVDFLDRLDARLGTPGADTVAVSIRAGGDYQALGWAIEPQWYHQAAATIADRLGAARFVVVSDVPAAADAAAARLADLGPAISAARLEAPAQLHVMAALDHAVVGPSSFAWWGAWCGDYRVSFDPTRIVVAPKPWVHERFDRTPSHRWHRLPAPGACPAPPG